MKFLLPTALAVAFACSPGLAAPVTLTFDELEPCEYHGPYGSQADVPLCGVLADQYPGVTFSSNAPNFLNQADPGLFDDMRVATFLFPEVAHSVGNIIAPWDGEFFVFNAEFYVAFGAPANNISFWTGGDEALEFLAVLDIFGVGDVLLGTIDLLSGFQTLAFHDLAAFTNVTRLAVRDIVAGASGGAALYYDTFSFEFDEISEVPLPPGIALLLTGLAGLGAAARRKARA